MTKVSIVLGAGWGDEGKGKTVDFLSAKDEKAMIIRFNGGHQAGHTVYADREHVFASFGSGTLSGKPTYWSNFCTFYPISMLNERKALIEINKVEPVLYVDELSPMTTPYDLFYNRAVEGSRHTESTCGVGFGHTLERHERFFKLYAMDMSNPFILKSKIKMIRTYYEKKASLCENINKLYNGFNLDDAEEEFLEACQNALKVVKIISERDMFKKLEAEDTHVVFEGAQGILLDQDFGIFPYVTRSNTTSKNALDLMTRNVNFGTFDKNQITIYYVTRAFHTRHGDGPFLPTIEKKFTYTENNKFNMWQGNLKLAYLDLDLLMYAINCDKNFSRSLKKVLVINHLDQMSRSFFSADSSRKWLPFTVTKDGKNKDMKLEEIFPLVLPNGEYMIGYSIDSRLKSFEIEEKSVSLQNEILSL